MAAAKALDLVPDWGKQDLCWQCSSQCFRSFWAITIWSAWSVTERCRLSRDVFYDSFLRRSCIRIRTRRSFGRSPCHVRVGLRTAQHKREVADANRLLGNDPSPCLHLLGNT